jgi:hypothetical protein
MPDLPCGFKFPLGKIILSRAVVEMVAKNEEISGHVCVCLLRHAHGDFGELYAEDRLANQSALIRGGRLFSSYDNDWIWIISEADRSTTTILRPSEY